MTSLKRSESMFKNKILMITGGTGSFGKTVLKYFLNTDIAEIRIFSRDEKKQEDMRIGFSNDKLKFFIGDVRDYDSLHSALTGVDYIFHAAALKQVPSCEFYPMEAVKTNILGTENVIKAAVANKVKRVVVLSTDKAVYPREYPKLCVWGLAHAVKTDHLLNRSGYRIANWFRATTHSLTQRPFFSKLRIAR